MAEITEIVEVFFTYAEVNRKVKDAMSAFFAVAVGAQKTYEGAFELIGKIVRQTIDSRLREVLRPAAKNSRAGGGRTLELGAKNSGDLTDGGARQERRQGRHRVET
jgi:hypothetical protein